MNDTSKRRRGEHMGGAFVADPRPQVSGNKVVGARCTACGYPSAPPAPWCPACQCREQAPAEFGPGGKIWSSTLVHIPVGKWQPPYALAYVDLDPDNVNKGPRVLAHLQEARMLPADTRVNIVAVDGDDLVVTADNMQEHSA